VKAIVMGGGMGGLATAINLLDLGIDVTLLEADEIFGGRTSSWLDEDGDNVDNALHVFFPYYVNLLNFFKKMDIEQNIIWKDIAFVYAQPGGKQAVLKLKQLPAPFHAMLGIANLLKDYEADARWKMLLGVLPMGTGLLMNKKKLEELDNISLATWIRRFAPVEGLKAIEPGINGLTFTPTHAVSAKVGLNWIIKIAGSSENARVGFASDGLGEIWVGNCLDYIKAKGGEVALKKAVTALNIEDGKVKSIVVNESEAMEADIYVSAITPFALRRILPEEAYSYQYFRDLLYFQYAPSLSLQIWFDRKLTDVDQPFFGNDCIFNTFADLSNVLPDIFKGGTMFEMVLSPADHILGLPDKVIFDIAMGQIKDRFPLARDAEVKKYLVVRERQGIYRPSPGMERHRPFQRSPYDNLYLTGDYTKTHVSSAGMEAAIWNANKAAELIAMDKMRKTISLNIEYKPELGFVRYMKLASIIGLGASALAAKRALKWFITR